MLKFTLSIGEKTRLRYKGGRRLTIRTCRFLCFQSSLGAAKIVAAEVWLSAGRQAECLFYLEEKARE